MVGAPRRSAGFTYLTILFVVAFMGAGLALAGEVWHTAALRDKEAELLHVGNEYRKAIERYYLSGPRQYPRTLEDLLKDPRHAGTVRHLRKLYLDPITGGDWAVVKAPDGGIAGVHSLSTEAPTKVAGFPAPYKDFSKALNYAEWKFVFVPAAGLAPKPQPVSSGGGNRILSAIPRVYGPGYG